MNAPVERGNPLRTEKVEWTPNPSFKMVEAQPTADAVEMATEAVREYLFGHTGFCTNENDDGGRVMASYGGNWIYLDPAAIAKSVLTTMVPSEQPDAPSDCGNLGWCHQEGRCTRHGVAASPTGGE